MDVNGHTAAQEAINQLIADHALAGLRLTTMDPAAAGVSAVFGSPDWATAQWHARRIGFLAALRDADPARADAWMREHTLASLARKDEG